MTRQLRSRKRQQEPPDKGSIKHHQKPDLFNSLPPELILNIFSYLSKDDLSGNVRLVCKKWHLLAMEASPWRKVYANKELKSEQLLSWLKKSPNIKKLTLSERNDVNLVVKCISKHVRSLNEITVVNCFGSPSCCIVNSKGVCDLLSKCIQLRVITFANIYIGTCKFLEMLQKKYPDFDFAKAFAGFVAHRQIRIVKESHECKTVFTF